MAQIMVTGLAEVLHRLRRNIIDVSRWIPGGFRDHATVDFEPYY